MYKNTQCDFSNRVAKLRRYADKLTNSGQYNQALLVYEHALEMCETVVGYPYPPLAGIYICVANLNWYQFNHHYAAHYYVKAIQVWVQHLPVENAFVTNTCSHLMEMLKTMYTSTQALSVFVDLLQKVQMSSSDIEIIRSLLN